MTREQAKEVADKSWGQEIGPQRRSAVDELRERGRSLTKHGEELRMRGFRMIRLADKLEEIRKCSTSKDGSEDSPHIGIGSDAEMALWELVTSQR